MGSRHLRHSHLMAQGVDRRKDWVGRDRLGSAMAVVVVHLAMGYLLLSGLGVELVREANEKLQMVSIAPEPDPPKAVPSAPASAASVAEEGEASAANLRAVPTQVTAPQPQIVLPLTPPIIVAPVSGSGSEGDAGAADRRGPGTGAGGIGDGLGSGGAGSGTGAGVGREARLIRGRIRHSDYPRSAVIDRAGGRVVMHLSVSPDGRVDRCTIARSSGRPDLDETSCRLIQQRFRFEPARDAEGRPIASTFGWQQQWWLERD